MFQEPILLNHKLHNTTMSIRNSRINQSPPLCHSINQSINHLHGFANQSLCRSINQSINQSPPWLCHSWREWSLHEPPLLSVLKQCTCSSCVCQLVVAVATHISSFIAHNHKLISQCISSRVDQSHLHHTGYLCKELG